MCPVFTCQYLPVSIHKREYITSQQSVFISITIRIFLQFHLETRHRLKEVVAPSMCVG